MRKRFRALLPVATATACLLPVFVSSVAELSTELGAAPNPGVMGQQKAEPTALPPMKRMKNAVEVVEEHLAAINECNWARLMAQYPDQVQFFLPGGQVVKGREAVGELFRNFVRPVQDGGLCGLKFAVENRFAVGDTINVQWQATGAFLAEPYRGADAYVTKDGLMWAQVTTFDAAQLKKKSAAPFLAAAPSAIQIDTPMPAPAWAKLERRILNDSAPACREFFEKYYDGRGYLQAFLRWGANDGPDDAFENFNHWPELHALGASDEVLQLYLKGWEGMTRQYSEAKTTEVPAGRAGMYVKDFSAQSDWMHHGEGLQLFNRMGLSVPTLPAYRDRARRFAGFYMGEDPDAPNYDPDKKLIRSMINGSRGPMLRQATALDWVGDPFDAKGFVALHGESTYSQFLEHYREYTDVVGDHFLNLVATTLPTNAYLLTGDSKYRRWIVEYMDAWLGRMQRNNGIIPSFVDLDGKIGGADARWWGNAYGWGFSPINPVTGRREDRNRIPRALVGFSNALLVTGDQKYVDAWRTMIDAVNSNAREAGGVKEYPTMFGADGWYGWQRKPWSVGALEVWYWSMRTSDRPRVSPDPWLEFLEGKNADYPVTALQADLDSIAKKLESIRQDRLAPEKRLADNMLDLNPAATDALVRLMLGALVPGREGGLLNARLRYFDPTRRRAGVPEDVAALVSALDDRRTVVTLVNLNPTESRTLIVQAGAYGEHQFETVEWSGQTKQLDAHDFTVRLAPGAGAALTLATRRYVNAPTIAFPWDR